MDAAEKPRADVVEAAGRPRADVAGLVIAAALLVMSGVIWWDMMRLELSSTYGLGPQAMPIVVGTGLGLLGIANLVLALRGDLPVREHANPRPILLIVGGLAALIALIGLGGGFIPATTILFAATATAFGRRAVLADLAIGFALSVVAYLLFAKLLSLSLPMGPLERLI